MAPALSLAELTSRTPWDAVPSPSRGEPGLVGDLADWVPDSVSDAFDTAVQVAKDLIDTVGGFIGPIVPLAPGDEPPAAFPADDFKAVVAGLKQLVQTHTVSDPVGLAKALFSVVRYFASPEFRAALPLDAILDVLPSLQSKDFAKLFRDLAAIQAFVQQFAGLMRAQAEPVEAVGVAAALGRLEMVEGDVAAGRIPHIPAGVLLFLLKLAVTLIFHVPLSEGDHG